MNIRPLNGYRTYPRIDLDESRRYRKAFNCAGLPRLAGRSATALRWYLLSLQETPRCEVPDCPYCENAIMPVDMLELDHVIPVSDNGPASIAYAYGTPETDPETGTYRMVPYGPTGKSRKLVVPATPRVGGESILALLYGEQHAARIMDPEYRTEYDPRNSMIVCHDWNNAHGNTAKANELDLIQRVVARQVRAESRNPWLWETNRPVVQNRLESSTYATASRLVADIAPAVATRAETPLPTWPGATLGRFSRIALYPVN